MQCAAVSTYLTDIMVEPQNTERSSASTIPAIMGNSFTPVSVPPTILDFERKKKERMKSCNSNIIYSIYSNTRRDTYRIVPSALAIYGVLRPLHGPNLAEETTTLRPYRRRKRHDHRARRGYDVEPPVTAITMRGSGIDLHG